MHDLPTPCALIDAPRLQRNLRRMQSRLYALGVAFRPHVKTSKCVAVAERQRALGAQGITVSTLKEAEQFFAAGFDDILYAVCLAPNKIEQALALRARGCGLRLVVDSLAAAQALIDATRARGVSAPVLIEIDVDGHRSGVAPGSALLLDIGRALHQGGLQLLGVMTHAGSSYDCVGESALQRIAEQERALCVQAAERLRGAGLPCPVVSVGSTPTALSALHLDGVTEVRAGVYALFDLVMAGVGVCTPDEIALSVLTTVIGHQAERGWVIVDAGWMAMSRDRGTQTQALDCGYGLVCDASGRLLDGARLGSANQEHGIVSFAGAADGAVADVVARFPIGTRLRILPNHACATGAQHERYRVVDGARVIDDWPRFNGW
jgi:threo-3-hydroxy-D-aspartate ammonia-lyase